jgi:OAR motif
LTTCAALAADPTTSQSNDETSGSLTSPVAISSDARTSSVAELRRKAQEHSAALLHSLHAVAVSGLYFPPLSLHHALSRNHKNGHHHHHHMASDYISDLSLQHNNNNNIISKVEPNEKVENLLTSNKSSGD